MSGPKQSIMAVAVVTVSVEIGPWEDDATIADVIRIAEREAPAKLETALQAQHNMHVSGVVVTRVVAAHEKVKAR